MLSVWTVPGIGASGQNLLIYQVIAEIVGESNMPWIIAGDFNAQPDELRSAEVDRLAGGIIFHQAP